MKIYTKTGDKGKTSLLAGGRVKKSHLRIEAYGTIDELNSFTGVLSSNISADRKMNFSQKESLLQAISRIQHTLFNAGSIMACAEKPAFEIKGVEQDDISFLEKEMDRMNETLPELKNFILPGGSSAASGAHVCRSVCRRAERLAVQVAEEDENINNIVIYINRLSDYFFVLARKLNLDSQTDEVVWVS